MVQECRNCRCKFEMMLDFKLTFVGGGSGMENNLVTWSILALSSFLGLLSFMLLMSLQSNSFNVLGDIYSNWHRKLIDNILNEVFFSSGSNLPYWVRLLQNIWEVEKCLRRLEKFGQKSKRSN